MSRSECPNTARIVAAIMESRRPFKESSRPISETTYEDYFRLAEQAESNGVKILTVPQGDEFQFFATSGRVDGLAYAVSPAYGCSCHGYKRAKRCQHYSALLKAIEAAPFHNDEPEWLNPNTLAELVEFRATYNAIQATRAEGVSEGTVELLIAELLARLEMFLIAAESEGHDRDELRGAWKEAGKDLAAPAITGIAAIAPAPAAELLEGTEFWLTDAARDAIAAAKKALARQIRTCEGMKKLERPEAPQTTGYIAARNAFEKACITYEAALTKAQDEVAAAWLIEVRTAS